jgi:hypothetical protein
MRDIFEVTSAKSIGMIKRSRQLDPVRIADRNDLVNDLRNLRPGFLEFLLIRVLTRGLVENPLDII